jgi:predicted amino acid-binding ACT domain protein
MMLAPQANQRCSPRSLVIFPISITGNDGAETHAGIVRDISKDGIFFYSSYKPQPQETITFILHMSGNKIACTGQVLRVEQKAPGAAVGVAVKIQSSTAIIGT